MSGSLRVALLAAASVCLFFAAGCSPAALDSTGRDHSELAPPVPADAAEGSRERDTVLRLHKALGELRKSKSADTSPAPSAPTSPPEDAPLPAEGGSATEAEVAALAEEVATLAEGLRVLEDTVALYVETYIADLERENEVLRREMARLYTSRGQPIVPAPGRDVLDRILGEPRETGPAGLSSPQPSQEGGEDAGFTILKAWGRSPEEAGELEPKAASLKGMIAAVPEGTPREELAALGRRLRTRFEAYDNINIEVFEGVEAARQFAEKNVNSPDRRVLNISKYADSGRDVIFLFRDGQPVKVAPAE